MMEAIVFPDQNEVLYETKILTSIPSRSVHHGVRLVPRRRARRRKTVLCSSLCLLFVQQHINPTIYSLALAQQAQERGSQSDPPSHEQDQQNLPPQLLQTAQTLHHPNFLACHAHPDWRRFLENIQAAHSSGQLGTYNEDLVFEAQKLLHEYEDYYLMAQNSKRMFVECAWETRDWEKAVENIQINSWLRREVGQLERRGRVQVDHHGSGSAETETEESSLEAAIEELARAREEDSADRTAAEDHDAGKKFAIYSTHYPRFIQAERSFTNSQPLFLNHSEIYYLYTQNVEARLNAQSNENPPFCLWGYYMAALVRSRFVQLDESGGEDRDRLVVAHMLQRMLMERANIANVADLSGWPVDHLTMIRFLWPSEGWRISQPGGAPSDVSDSFRPLTMSGAGPGGDVLFQLPEQYPRVSAKELRIGILGYHTTLALEPAKILEILPQTFNPNLKIKIRVEVVEDGLEVDGKAELDWMEKQVDFSGGGENQNERNSREEEMAASSGRRGTMPGDREADVSKQLLSEDGNDEDDAESSSDVSTERSRAAAAEDREASSPAKPPFSLCKYFDVCATDTRLLYLNRKYLRRVRLPKTDISNPQFTNIPDWIAEFVELFRHKDPEDPGPGQSGPGAIKSSSSEFLSLDRADVFFCTEPAVLCLPMALAFPSKLLLGYFGNPLAAYVPADHVQAWLAHFRDLPNLFPVSNTRFLAKQMEYQTGRYVNTVRPLALYVTEGGGGGGATWAPPTLGRDVGNANLYPEGEGSFGNYHDDWARQTATAAKRRDPHHKSGEETSSEMSSSQQEGRTPPVDPTVSSSTPPPSDDEQKRSSSLRASRQPPRDNYLHRPGPLAQTVLRQILVLREVSVFWDMSCLLNLFSKLNNARLRFHYSDALVDKSYAAFGKFDAVVIFPYDASQMRFYEFYAMNMPIMLPRKMVLASYVFRGMTSIEDFDHRTPELAEQERNVDKSSRLLLPNPFSRWDYDVASFWSLYTHYFLLPHLMYFRSAAELFELLSETPADELIALGGKMKKKNSADLALALKFWGEALNVQGLG